MSYSTVQDIKDEMKGLRTDGIVSESQVESWIDQADAYINGRLSKVYATPIVGPNSLKIIKWISIGLVAQRVSRFLDIKSTTIRGDQYIPKDMIKEAKETLDMIVNRELLLSDSEPVTDLETGISSYTSDNEVERTFKQGVDQW